MVMGLLTLHFLWSVGSEHDEGGNMAYITAGTSQTDYETAQESDSVSAFGRCDSVQEDRLE